MRGTSPLVILFILIIFIIQLSLCSSKTTTTITIPVATELNEITQSLLKGNLQLSSASELVRAVLPLLEGIVERHGVKPASILKPLWYQFLPVYEASVLPNGQQVEVNSPCFRTNYFSANMSSDKKEADIQITTADGPSSKKCEDFYLLGTLQDLYFLEVKDKMVLTHKWPLDLASAAEIDDIEKLGFRIFRFIHDSSTVVAALIETFKLFIPELKGPKVEPEAATANINFIRTYAQFAFPPRKIQNVTIDPSTISSGDFIGVTRLDGLDPMIIWGMGGTTGHTTVALRIQGELFVCESTVSDVYWPTNGIQCTPFPTWLQQAYNASYLFIHVPLSPENRAKFNETSAFEFVNKSLGLPYGYHNFLFGWIDTHYDNFPCIPDNFTFCLSPQALQVVSGIIDRTVPSISYKMYNQALNFRIGANFSRTAEIYQYARDSKGLNFTSLIIIPEQDKWVYNDGPSMVCDVFVCNVLRAGGLFGEVGDQFQCSELTPRDVYSLNLWDTNVTRPEACVVADPDLPFCQLGGDYELNLPGYNEIEIYPNYANNCPGVPPYYLRPKGC